MVKLYNIKEGKNLKVVIEVNYKSESRIFIDLIVVRI